MKILAPAPWPRCNTVRKLIEYEEGLIKTDTIIINLQRNSQHQKLLKLSSSKRRQDRTNLLWEGSVYPNEGGGPKASEPKGGESSRSKKDFTTGKTAAEGKSLTARGGVPGVPICAKTLDVYEAKGFRERGKPFRT